MPGCSHIHSHAHTHTHAHTPRGVSPSAFGANELNRTVETYLKSIHKERFVAASPTENQRDVELNKHKAEIQQRLKMVIGEVGEGGEEQVATFLLRRALRPSEADVRAPPPPMHAHHTSRTHRHSHPVPTRTHIIWCGSHHRCTTPACLRFTAGSGLQDDAAAAVCARLCIAVFKGHRP